MESIVEENCDFKYRYNNKKDFYEECRNFIIKERA